MGVAGYSEIAHILGLNSVAERYADIAKKMAMKWEENRVTNKKGNTSLYDHNDNTSDYSKNGAGIMPPHSRICGYGRGFPLKGRIGGYSEGY